MAIVTSDFPQIVILDEPTANLDSELAEEVMQEIYNLHSSKDITFLIATHDINLIKDGYRVIVLEDGKIETDQEIYGKFNPSERRAVRGGISQSSLALKRKERRK